jgi:hypothetical protein
MANAMVFVDDAVLGRLPPVCAKTGVATSDHLVMTAPIGGNEGLGIAWLLVLAGPIGWLGLFIYQVGRRVETITVRLPYCDAAYGELSRARRSRRHAGWAMGALFVFAVLLAVPGTFAARAGAAALGVIALGLLIGYITETLHVRRASVGIELDGSRRWVTMSRVSESFAQSIKKAQPDAKPEIGSIS